MKELEQKLVFFLLAGKFHRGVAALGKVTAKIAGSALQRKLDLLFAGAVGRQLVLKFKDGEEAAGDGVVGGNGLDMPDVVLVHLYTGGIFFLLQFLCGVLQEFGDVRAVRVGLELQLDRRDPQQLGKGQNNIPLLRCGTQQKVDGLDLNDFDVPSVLGDDHAPSYIGHRKKLLRHVVNLAALGLSGILCRFPDLFPGTGEEQAVEQVRALPFPGRFLFFISNCMLLLILKQQLQPFPALDPGRFRLTGVDVVAEPAAAKQKSHHRYDKLAQALAAIADQADKEKRQRYKAKQDNTQREIDRQVERDGITGCSGQDTPLRQITTGKAVKADPILPEISRYRKGVIAFIFFRHLSGTPFNIEMIFTGAGVCGGPCGFLPPSTGPHPVSGCGSERLYGSRAAFLPRSGGKDAIRWHE